MIVVKLQGGLGNQMFQYAAGKSLAVKNDSSLLLDLEVFNSLSTPNTPRNFELDVFTLTYKNFSEKKEEFLYKIEEYIFPTKYIAQQDSIFNSDILTLKGNLYLDGYWQNEKYFKEIEGTLIDDFNLKGKLNKSNSDYLDQIISTNSISVHFRRGDYVSLPAARDYHGTCSNEYYNTAVKKVKERIYSPHFFIFSDDAEWVKENITFEDPHTFIEGNSGKDSFEDLRLMAACKHNILANSSFSWWGGWLNQNKDKIIIAPKKWFIATITDIVPERWIQL